MSLEVWFPDTSPLFKYGVAGSGRWTAQANNQSGALYNTLHRVEEDGSALLPLLNLTSFTPYWDASSAMSVGLTIGKASPQTWTSGKSFNQTMGPMAVAVQTKCDAGADKCATDQLRFYGATLGTQAVQGGNGLSSVTVDDADPVIYYDGFSNERPGEAVQPSGRDYNDTLSWTTMSDASASVTFRGSSVLVSGAVGPLLGPYRVMLDGVTFTYSSASEIEDHAVPLFFASGLDPAENHQLVMMCLYEGQNRTGLVLDQMTVWGQQGAIGFIGSRDGVVSSVTATIPLPTGVAGLPPGGGPVGNSTVSPLPGATNSGGSQAGVIVGAILGALAGCLLLFFMFRKYTAVKAAKAKKLSDWDEANLLQNMKNENVHVTTVANQRYVYRLIAHSELK